MYRSLEITLERRVVRDALRFGIPSTKLNVWGRRGQLDRIFWIPGGRPLLLELKRQGEKLRKLQVYTAKQLKGLNYDAKSADNYETAVRHIRESCIAARLDSTRLSKTSSAILAQVCERWSIFGPGIRKNKHRS